MVNSQNAVKILDQFQIHSETTTTSQQSVTTPTAPNNNSAGEKAKPIQDLQQQHHSQVPVQSPLPTLSASSPSLPYLHEIPHEDEERLERIFNKIDRDNNGRIDIHDLSAALKEFGLSSVYAERFLEQSDQTQSGDVGLAEFIHYVREHEKSLRLQFTHLDKNRDGKVDLEELITAFKELGIEMDKNEATKLLQRMDQDGSLNISFDEWRDFLLLAPSTDIHDLIKFWRHSTVSVFLSKTVFFSFII